MRCVYVVSRSVGLDESRASVVGDSEILHCACVSLLLRLFTRRASALVSTAQWSVYCYWHCPHSPRKQYAAAGLLLRARRAGDIDRLLQQQCAAGECGQCHVVSVHR